jgi:hypothetical protein
MFTKLYSKNSTSCTRDPESGEKLIPDPGPGSSDQKSTGGTSEKVKIMIT